MKSIYLRIKDFNRKEGRLVLATVIATRGSTPQKAGSSALFSRNGLIAGTIGGGILEGNVQKLALLAAESANTAIHHFELNRDISFKEDAICGGQATVLIDSDLENCSGVFDEIAESLEKNTPCILCTIIKASGNVVLGIERFLLRENSYDKFPSLVSDKLRDDARILLSDESGRDAFIKTDLGQPGDRDYGFILFESIFPPLQLVIAGAGHIGKSLSHIGKLLDFEVTVVDDRKEFANQMNLPDADHIIVGDIGESMISMAKTQDTYIVIVTRGHNDDAKALRPCIGSRAAYVGMIGSRTKIEKMHVNFVENGWATEEQWSALHAPIGIEINSKSVEEIAISIAAELVMVRNRNKSLN